MDDQQKSKEGQASSSSTPTPPPAPHEHKAHKPFVGPLILIIIGVLWLVSSLGVHINWALAGALLLIGIGIAMFFGRTRVGGWIVALVILIAIFGGLFTMTGGWWDGHMGWWWDGDTVNGEPITATTATEAVRQDAYPDAKALDLNVDLGAGEYALTTRPSSTLLFDSSATYNRSYLEPTLLKQTTGDTLALTYQTRKDASFLFGRNTAEYTLNIGKPELPTDLTLSVGAGKGTIDLDNLAMKTLDLNIGAGEMDVTVSGTNPQTSTATFDVGAGKIILDGLGDANMTTLTGKVGAGSAQLGFGGTYAQSKLAVDLDIGLGSTEIVIPSSVGFSITPDIGLGNVKVYGDTIEKDKRYESSNYAAAANHIDFKVDVGSGSVEITTS